MAAISESAYFVFPKPYLEEYGALAFTTYSVWAGTALLLVFLPGLAEQVRDAPVGAALSVVYLGIGPTAVAYVALASVFARTDASKAGSFLSLIPVLAFVIAFAWLGEKPGALSLLDERLRTCLETDHPPDMGTLWQICLFFEFDEKELIEGLAAWLGRPDGQRVLDCACGSGFPALALARRGYDVTCSDGSEVMLRHFARNARILGVPLRASLVDWDELPDRYGAEFDVVMCRGGGSYLYAGTWDSNDDPDWAVLRDSLRRFVGRVRPGGRLYLDITKAEDLANPEPQVQEHPRLLIGSHAVHLVEVVTADPEAGTRSWRSWLTIDGRTFEFERRSHYLPHGRLVELLRDCGLEDVHREDIPGERYDVYVGVRA